MGITLEKPFVSLLQVPVSALVGGLLDQLIVLCGNMKFNGLCAGRGALVLTSCAEISGGSVKVMRVESRFLKEDFGFRHSSNLQAPLIPSRSS